MARERVVAEVTIGKIAVINKTKTVSRPESIAKDGKKPACSLGADIYQVILLYEKVRLEALGYFIQVKHHCHFFVLAYSSHHFYLGRLTQWA